MTPGVDLVTGGAGFLGPHLIRVLLGSGRRVIVLDNLLTGQRANLTGFDPAEVELVVGSLLDTELAASLLPRVERVFNLACVGMRQAMTDETLSHEVNATGVVVLLEAARRAPVARIVHVSSSEVYGTAIRLPIDETHPTAPTSVYGASKLAGEAYARAYHRRYGLPVVIVRPFNAYGPGCYLDGSNVEVIPRFMTMAMDGKPLTIMGDGAQTRAFTYVEDTVRGLSLAASAEGVVGETINLGHPNAVSVAELAQKIGEIAGSAAPIVRQPVRPGEVSRVAADSSKAAALLQWTPAVGIDAGLAHLHEWLLKMRERAA
jgi:UDP-glucose 4-epimerase